MSEEAQRDAWLDAIAFVAAIHHDREEGLKAILDANWDCPGCLENLFRALALLVVHALQDHPPGGVDGALCEARRFFLEQG